MEALAAGARQPFDTASDFTLPPSESGGNPTPFFGDTMPTEDLQLLVNPENDPRVVDLRKVKTLIVDSLKTEAEQRAATAQPMESKIRRLHAMSRIGNFSDVLSSANDWQTFIKDGMSGLINQLTSLNDEIKGMLEDPGMQKYFTADAPELNALLDINRISASNKVLGKWVARKMPIIAMLEISTKQLYNATDWYLSFKRIAEANKINGQATTLPDLCRVTSMMHICLYSSVDENGSIPVQVFGNSPRRRRE